MKWTPYKYIGAGVIGLAIAFLAGTSFRSVLDDDQSNTFTSDGRLIYKWSPAQMPSQLNFAEEKTPLERWEVEEAFDRELQSNFFRHGGMIYIIKLSNRFFPTIERILKENGVPDDFKYLCVAESSLQNLTSPAQAVGYWQFLKQTAIQYGLEVTDEVDERYHLEKSTVAAAKYLKAAYNKFGTWTAAAASYNCGTGGYNSRATHQGSDKYYDLMLPEETNRYIFRILAYKHLMSNAETLGFVIPKNEMYQPYKTKKIPVSSSIPDLATWAKQNGTSYKLVKILNPWLRDRKLTNTKGKTYEIHIPA